MLRRHAPVLESNDIDKKSSNGICNPQAQTLSPTVVVCNSKRKVYAPNKTPIRHQKQAQSLTA